MASAPPALPVHIRKNIGADARTLLGALGLVLLVQGLPLLASGRQLGETLLHSGTTWVLLLMAALVTAMLVVFRNVSTLDIDRDGVRVASKKTQYFYAWTDISQVVCLKTGVRLEVKGLSDAQNSYNVISSRFGIKPDDLATLIRDGVGRWGLQTAPTRSCSVTPGNDVKAASMGALKRIVMVQGLIFGCVFVGLVVWQITSYNKAAELQRHGVKTEASVVRLYNDLCGRHGCDMSVEYEFQAGDGKTYHGYASLAGDDYRDDPDYQYAVRQRTVPVAFDSTDPNRSDLNFRNSVFSGNPLSLALTMIAVFVGIMIVVGGLLIGMTVYVTRSAQRRAAGLLPMSTVS